MEEVFGTMSRPSGTLTLASPYTFSDDNPNQTQEMSHIGEQNVDMEMVGLDIAKSSHHKQKTLRSDVWKQFEKCKDKDGKDVAKCNLCGKSFDGSSKKGTTHLRNHFKSCQNKRNEGGASGSRDKPAGNSVTDQQLNHLDRVKMFIKQWPRFSPNPVPVVDAADIINVYNEEKEKLRKYFEKLSCRFSLTITDVGCRKCTGFMVRFIDDDWKLREKFIGLKCIEGDQHMEVIKNVLSDLGIDNKISSMVTDDDSDKYFLSSDERDNRFSGQGSLLSNCKFCIRNFYIVCQNLEEVMLEVLYGRMSKILKYIRETSSKNGTFQMAIDRARSLGKQVTAEEIPMEEEMLSLYLVKIALGLKEAFFELENMDLHFKSINQTKEEWDLITAFYESDDEDYDPDSVTANMIFSKLCRAYKTTLLLVTRDWFVKDVKKCWEQCNLILAVAAVLDPRFKMDIVQHWYKKIYGDECGTQLAIFMDYFNGVYNEYAKGTDNFQSSISYDISDHGRGQSFNFELHQYLNDFPLIQDFDLLEWWRLHSRYFPTLAKMARDFLSLKFTTRYYLFHILRNPPKLFDSDIVIDAFVCAEKMVEK
ncbi:hypothetical protein Ddye_027513 [Dipteronia dyeriana]|uniref:BED-type domain-containing protein n=1 Tax=Dipteronia dyeriana TaxID=168575 RepID=A0AAD9TPP1_9ROSI|nr:hypothetical protein Ddye_027513 [Dipteronia dyeriana]